MASNVGLDEAQAVVLDKYLAREREVQLRWKLYEDDEEESVVDAQEESVVDAQEEKADEVAAITAESLLRGKYVLIEAAGEETKVLRTEEDVMDAKWRRRMPSSSIW